MMEIPNINIEYLEMIPRARTLVSSPWTGIVVILAIATLVVTISIHRKQYELKLKSLLTNRSRTMTYEIEQTERWANTLLWIIVTGSLALSSVILIQKQKEYVSLIDFISVFAVIGGYLWFKLIIMKLIGYTFDLKEAASDFISSNYVIIALGGCINLIIGIGLMYNETWWNSLINCTIGLNILTLTAIVFKAIQIFYSGITSLFYIFLYLCTIEILPILIILKLTTSYIFV